MKIFAWSCAFFAAFMFGVLCQKYLDDSKRVAVEHYSDQLKVTQDACDETAYKQSLLVRDFIDASCGP